MPKGSFSRETRLQVMLASDELAAVDDFRFKTRMPSRAAAFRELIRLGLANVMTEGAVSGQQSSTYGVLDSTDKDSKNSKRLKIV